MIALVNPYIMQPAYKPTDDGAKGWWDFSDNATQTLVSSKISQINDKTASALNLTQGTDARRPTQGTDSTTGLLKAAFSTSVMVGTDAAGWEPASSTDGVCWIIACKPSSWNAYGYLVTKNGTTDTQEWQIRANAGATALTGGVNGQVQALGSIPTSRCIVIMRYTHGGANGVRMYLNSSTSYSSFTYSTDITQNATNVLMGAGTTSGTYAMTGDIFEAVWFNTNPADAAVTRCFDYLKAKWQTP